MKQIFAELFEVIFVHDYFVDKILRNIELLPTPATRQQLSRAGIILKKTDSGLIGLIELKLDDLQKTIANLPGQIFPLIFSVQPTDVYFENYSELPLNKAFGQTYFLSTREVKPYKITVSCEDHVGEKDLCHLKPMLFEYLLPTVASPDKLVKLVDFNKKELLETFSYPDKNSTQSILVDLRQWGDGSYQLQIDAQVVLSFYADSYLHSLRPWGILEIAKSAIGKEQPIAINFADRETYWKYIIIKKYQLDKKIELEIISGSSIRFLPANIPLTDFFVSESPIALSERNNSPNKIQGKSEGVLSPITLPHAGKETLTRDNMKRNPDKLVSEMYVYL
ncbi:hypothetical protein [Spirosoma flavum]|uniref:WYL domain-containing protein n=1 Tax=Spirosoma flavum TaxID=2048557 RepID=A0ABW6AID9_9BACT